MGNVYIIGDSQGFVKIGISNDPERRLTRLQSGNRCDLRLIYQVPAPNSRVVEGDIHDVLSERRERGEWFRIRDSELNKLCKLCREFAKGGGVDANSFEDYKATLWQRNAAVLGWG